MIGLGLDNNESVKSNLVRRKTQLLSIFVFVVLIISFFTTNAFGYVKILLQPTNDNSICPIHEKILPASYKQDNSTVLKILQDESFRLQSVKKLSDSIKVDTQITDNQPDVSEDPEVWLKFGNFHEYLEKTFPTIYENLKVETVNTYGLVYYWKGSDASLKPVLLTAHQDVVPVQNSTLGDWTYPPFEGHYDGTFVFGRGASDCKNVLIAILESLELLLAQGFNPQRGIIAAFGFDEEASGIRGASSLSKHLLSKFGENGIYSILDEGPGLSLDESSGQIIAAPAAGEKGYLDIEVSLTTPGGHSSIPPDHTSIGVMGELAYIIEKDPYNAILTEKNPILSYLQCLAVNTGNKLPKLTRKAILRAGFDKLSNLKVVEYLSSNVLTKYLIRTSQATDVIVGGEKANALPENVKLVINHRVAVETKISEITHHFTERVLIVAKKYGFSVESFGELVFKGDSSKGKFIVDFFSPALEAAPVSPSNDKVWQYIASTTRHVFEDLVFTNLTYPIIVAPSIMPANTDTRYYWNLTKNIYRYSPFFAIDMVKESHIHSVDEKIKFDSHLQLITFFYEYLQNIDTSDADN